jgi:hypothetical protein
MTDQVMTAIIAALALITTNLITGMVVRSTVLYRISELEKKMEKHNCLIERMVIQEQSTKSAHHRLDEFLHK